MSSADALPGIPVPRNRPDQAPDRFAASHRRLLPWLGLALLLHALLLFVPRLPTRVTTRLPAGIEVFLTAPSTQLPTPTAEIETTLSGGRPATAGDRPATAPGGVIVVPGSTAPAADQAETRAETELPSGGTAGSLIESARQQIREESRQRARSLPMGDSVPGPVSSENPLARALKAPLAGEKRFADGLMKVTRQDGSVYCVQPPRDFQRSDFDNVVATMTCP